MLAIVSAPVRTAGPVHGMRSSTPPMRSSRSPPPARSIDPAPRNSSALAAAWASACSRAAASATPAHRGSPCDVKHDRRAQRHGHDADVLDRREGQQALQIALEEGVGDPEQGRGRAEPDQQEAHPRLGLADPLQQQPRQPVEADAHHRPRHQRRHVGRRERVGARQPGVEGHQPGLGTEADDAGDRDRRRHRRPGARQALGVADAPWAASTISATHTPAPPMCVMARYSNTARRPVAVSRATRIAAAGTSVMSSQQARKVVTSRALRTPSRTIWKTPVRAASVLARPAPRR